MLLGQFKSILILILIGAAALAALVGSIKDAVVILAVVVINALVGFYQEYRAERSLDALKSMLPIKARVRRDGISQVISSDDVVPGDVLLLEAGDRVAADGRLGVAVGLEIDESALTGESQPVGKQAALLAALDAPLGDRTNLGYMNTAGVPNLSSLQPVFEPKWDAYRRNWRRLKKSPRRCRSSLIGSASAWG